MKSVWTLGQGTRIGRDGGISLTVLGAAVMALAVPAHAGAAINCPRTVKADVVVFDQPLMYNRLGAQNVNGIMYALRRDVIPLGAGTGLAPGLVTLRPDKRPRPLVLRVAAGDCLEVKFQNLLATAANPSPAAAGFNLPPVNNQVAGRMAGFHAQGLQLVAGIGDDASFVGRNASSLVAPGGSTTYSYFAEKEGAFLVTSHGATFGGDGSAGNSANGMFAVVNVEPPGARFYRSQVTEEEMRLCTTGTTDAGQPIIDYECTYPATVAITNPDGSPGTAPSVWVQEGKGGLPVLNMLKSDAIVHSDLNAVVVGSQPDGTFPPTTYPLESKGLRNPTIPNRLEPFREYTVVFHDEMAVSNAFPLWYLDPVLKHTLAAVGDVFQVNYGSGGVGSEVIANRLGVGPMHDCLDCVYEEFFLTSPAVGDPAMVVDVPANFGLEACAPPGTGAGCAANGPKATQAYYPDDPSNVHHGYISDFVKFRNVHTGKEHHIFHLHNHQWLFNPNDDNANYLDAQGIGPGGGYTYEINFGGAGNRNKSAGDAIFHCHFYPHFAQGMWELWRIHDVFETGTPLAVTPGAATATPGFHTVPFDLKHGTPAPASAATVTIPNPRAPFDPLAPPTIEVPAARARALPDGEIVAGTPIPAVVPLPGKALAVIPGKVTVVPKISTSTVPGTATPVQTTVGSNAKVVRPVVATDPNTGVATVTGCDSGDPAAACSDPAQVHATLNPNGIKNPGFPFWLAGVESTVGQRMPSPPLDMDVNAGGWDGGLPRHALDGYAASGCPPGVPRSECAVGTQSRTDMTKEIHKAAPVWFPEDGTDLEKAAMAFHAVRRHDSYKLPVQGGAPQPAAFITNGSGRPVPGAPFHDPCIDDEGTLLRANVTGRFFDGRGSTGITGSSTFNADSPRVYKGANIQFDVVLNKLGYHFPQERIITLWEDAVPTITKQRAPEPLVLRMNTFDCVMYHHTNLVPAVYELDDFQIKTTTDIIGQHIHLPKWDLTTTDGSANGWNYEDGTFSPDAVRERIHAINAFNPTGAGNPANSSGSGAAKPLTALAHTYFGTASPGGLLDWTGARTTLQRWFSDPVVNVDGVHRGLGIIFTHDHYGPSTHQQVGLYATVLTEPPGATWAHNETGVPMYTRPDGGPTSWQAAITAGPNGQDSYREFYFEYTDFQLAYEPGTYIGRGQWGELANGPTAESYKKAVNPPVKGMKAAPFPDLLQFADVCPGGEPRPCPEAISADDPGFLVVNYRNEPLGFRVYDPAKLGPDGKPGSQADGFPGDLALALQSRTDRKLVRLNTQPVPGPAGAINGTQFPPPLNATDLQPGDPYTPLVRAYFGDPVRVKIQGGGDEESHSATIHGTKWLQGGSGHGFAPNSGWRNSQHAGISEQFTFASPALSALNGLAKADQLWSVNNSEDGYWNGTWGLMRTYKAAQPALPPLPNGAPLPFRLGNSASFNGVCPKTAVTRAIDVTAVLANDVLANAVGATIVPNDGTERMHVGAKNAAGVSALNPNGGTLVYNPRETSVGLNKTGALHDPTAMMLVRTADLVARNPADRACLVKGRLDPTLPACPVMLRAGAPVEPLVLRATAGECMVVTLRNRLPAIAPDLAGYRHLPGIVTRDANEVGGPTTFNNNLIRPSSMVGLHPSLLAFDVAKDNGTATGQNGLGSNGSGLLALPGQTQVYRWYAGDLSLVPAAGGAYNIVATPVEFGGTNLAPADMIKQGQKGLVGAIVIGPTGQTWTEFDTGADHQQAASATATRATRASATLSPSGARDFVNVIQKGLNLRYKDGTPVEMFAAEAAIAEDAEDSGHVAINYGAEPLWFRFGMAPNSPLTGGEGAAGGSLADVANAHMAFSNELTGGDPATPVFSAPAGAQVRMHLLQPTGYNRASSFTLHGHVWQQAPYVCPGSAKDGLTGKCLPTGFLPSLAGEVGSRAIGTSPLDGYMSAQDLIQPGSHFTLFLPSAGGGNAVRGDYLLMDRAGYGTTNGLWSLLRVQ